MVKSKISARFILFALALVAVISIFSMVNIPKISVYAENGIEDNLNSSSGSSSSDNILGGLQDQEIDPDDQGVADWLKNQRGVTSDQLNSASEAMSPITAMIGYIIGGIIILTSVLVVAITALDLLYIAVPPVRNILYKAGTDGTGGYTGGFGAGGYGRGMGGMGAMGAMGAGGAAGGSKKPTQWVSDEAVACAAMLGGSAQSVGGMGGMGAMGGMQQQQPTTRSVIGTYFRKRIFFIILLALCIIVLTSSALMNCGVNLAEWFLKIVNLINGKLDA